MILTGRLGNSYVLFKDVSNLTERAGHLPLQLEPSFPLSQYLRQPKSSTAVLWKSSLSCSCQLAVQSVGAQSSQNRLQSAMMRVGRNRKFRSHKIGTLTSVNGLASVYDIGICLSNQDLPEGWIYLSLGGTLEENLASAVNCDYDAQELVLELFCHRVSKSGKSCEAYWT